MSDEIKSIRDLNPIKQTPEVEAEVTAETETPATTEEVVLAEDSNSEPSEGIHHDDLPYISPEEDTSLGTNGAFDFASSINRRRNLVVEKIHEMKEEEAERQHEEEIEESDDTEPSNFNFNDENDDEEDTEPSKPVTKPVAKPVQNEIAKAAAPATPIKTEPVKLAPASELPTQSELFVDEDDFDEDDDEATNKEEALEQKALDALKSSITEKLKVTEANFDLSGFTVVKEAISVNTALEYDESTDEVFDWPMMSAGKLVSMKKFSGTEIDSLNGGNSRNRFNNLKDIYRELYNHISNPNKPEFEAWLKVTSFLDIPHLYMAAYKSSFNGANYIPFTCTDAKCNHIFLSDDIPIHENMVKFKDEAAKLKFNEIMENSSVSSGKLYETRIIPVSNKYAIGFREPSIYNTIFENAILDAKFVDKYQKLLSMMVYIDSVYLIRDGKVVPIAYKEDPNNMAKTTKSKISNYAKIIAKLPSDSYQKIISIISTINELGDEVTYQLPEVTCPKCSHVIPAEAKESSELLFSRHQLALIANS